MVIQTNKYTLAVASTLISGSRELPAGRFGGAVEFIKGRSRQKGARKYPLEIVALALQRTNGMVFKAAELLKCSPSTIYEYIKEHPELQELREAEKGLLLDNAETQLADAIRDRESWAICFFLKTQGKDRGYIERSEVTGKDGVPVQVDILEIKREKLTIAVQNGLNSGWPLRNTLEYLTLRGVSKEDLALVRGEDLIIPEPL